jgi:hypothetical protein
MLSSITFIRALGTSVLSHLKFIPALSIPGAETAEGKVVKSISHLKLKAICPIDLN